MKRFAAAFKPSWPRIFLESRLEHALSDLPSAEGRCLNLGCGVEGRYGQLLRHFDTDGVDIADPMGRPMPWRFHRCDARALPFPDATFDVGVAIEAFEHIGDNRAAMRELARTLKPGGVAIITTPSHWTWPYEFGRHGPHYYTRRALMLSVTDAGMKVRFAHGCGGLTFYSANLVKSWLSPLGVRLLGKRWWPLIDHILMPFYMIAYVIDPILRFLPSNWFLVAEKPREC